MEVLLFGILSMLSFSWNFFVACLSHIFCCAKLAATGVNRGCALPVGLGVFTVRLSESHPKRVPRTKQATANKIHAEFLVFMLKFFQQLAHRIRHDLSTAVLMAYTVAL
jgi:hypothetical protein